MCCLCFRYSLDISYQFSYLLFHLSKSVTLSFDSPPRLYYYDIRVGMAGTKMYLKLVSSTAAVNSPALLLPWLPFPFLSRLSPTRTGIEFWGRLTSKLISLLFRYTCRSIATHLTLTEPSCKSNTPHRAVLPYFEAKALSESHQQHLHYSATTLDV